MKFKQINDSQYQLKFFFAIFFSISLNYSENPGRVLQYLFNGQNNRKFHRDNIIITEQN